MAESRRRALLPEICSSHGRTSMMEGRPGTQAARMTIASVQRKAHLAGRALYLGTIFAPAFWLGLLVYVTGSQRLTSLWWVVLQAMSKGSRSQSMPDSTEPPP
eukprot:scaffold148280_cov41-Prasinocladus_malaysianus.AAC.1